MIAFLVVLLALTCAALVLFVLVQNSKGGGLATNIGGVGQVQQLFGARGSTNIVQRLTWGALVVLVLLSIAINFTYQYRQGGPDTAETQLRLGADVPVNATPTEIPTQTGTAPEETDAEALFGTDAPADSSGNE